MSKKKILVITGEFLPYTSSIGGVIRIVSFLKTLKKNKIKLISVKKKNYGYFGFEKYVKHTERKYINSNFLKKTFWSDLIFRIIKRLFSNILYIMGIDNSFFHINKIEKETMKTMVSFNPDFVLISAPPFSLFKIVKKIKKNFKKTKIILDYRDGWTQRVNSLLTLPIQKIMENVEKNIISKADYILCATSQISENLLKIVNKNKLILLTNGFFVKNKNKIKKKQNLKTIKIGYFGLISDSSNSYRDVKIIYKSLNNNSKLNFTFYGNSIIKNNKIKNYKKFKFKKSVSYFKALSKMREFDYLLILHTEKSTSKEVVTGKFYEYLSSCTPIILISNGETEVGRMIKKFNLGYVNDYSKESLDKFLYNLKINKFKFKKLKNVNKFSRDEQNKKLMKIIN